MQKSHKTVSKTAPNCALIQAHATASNVIATKAIPFTETDYMSCASTIKLVDNVFQMAECGTYIVNYCVQVVESAETANIKRAVETAKAAADSAVVTAGIANAALPIAQEALVAAFAAKNAAAAVVTAYNNSGDVTSAQANAATASNAAAATVGPTNNAAAAVETAARGTIDLVSIANLAYANIAPNVPSAKTAAVDANDASITAFGVANNLGGGGGDMASAVLNASDAALAASVAADISAANIAATSANSAYNTAASFYANAVQYAGYAQTDANNAQDAIVQAEIEAAELLAETAAAVQLFIYIPNCCQPPLCPMQNPITSTNWTPIECSRKSITGIGSINGTYQIEIKNRCTLVGLFNVGAGDLALDPAKSPNTFINIFRVCSSCCEAV